MDRRAKRAAIGFLCAAAGMWGGIPSLVKRPVVTNFFLYVGTFSEGGGKGKGIYAYRFDAAEGTAQPIGLAAELKNATALAVHPQNGLLYAVSDVKEGMISSFAIQRKTGVLRPLGSVSSLGEGPGSILVEKKGWMLLVTNYGTGSIVSFRIAGDGGVGGNTAAVNLEGENARPREVAVTPDNFFLFVPAAGPHRVMSYRFDPGRVTFWANNPAFVEMKAGAAPRRLVFAPDEKFAYAADEAAARVTAFRYNGTAGSLTLLQDYPTTPSGGPAANHTVDLEASADGRFLYALTGGADKVTVFAIRKKGELESVQQVSSGGKGSQSLRIDPAGQCLLVANRESGSLSVFQIDHKTGMLTNAGRSITVPSPAAMRFVPAETGR